MQNFQGLIKHETEFPGVTKKNSYGIFRGLGFWVCKGMYLQFCGISGVRVLACLKFLGVNLKMKNFRGFSKKYIVNPPPPSPLFMFFSGLAHFLVFQQKNAAISLSALILCSFKYGLSQGNLSPYWKLCHFRPFYLFIYLFFWKQDFPIWNEKKFNDHIKCNTSF